MLVSYVDISFIEHSLMTCMKYNFVQFCPAQSISFNVYVKMDLGAYACQHLVQTFHSLNVAMDNACVTLQGFPISSIPFNIGSGLLCVHTTLCDTNFILIISIFWIC